MLELSPCVPIVWRLTCSCLPHQVLHSSAAESSGCWQMAAFAHTCCETDANRRMGCPRIISLSHEFIMSHLIWVHQLYHSWPKSSRPESVSSTILKTPLHLRFIASRHSAIAKKGLPKFELAPEMSTWRFAIDADII